MARSVVKKDDSGENIKTEKITGPSGTKTHTYAYDGTWKDKLISYDGKSITYDVMGNPLNYMGATMKWDVKGNLTSVSGRNGKSATYKYLSDGQRYTKTTGGKTTTYLYNNGLLLSETTGTEVIHYYYDSDGTILGIGYKKGTAAEKHYFFEKNAFGDVIAIYRNSDSVLIGTYEYDLWGNPISVKEVASGRDTDGILQKNPFRYRCYYYDVETGFYYLNARYYDPQVRRFISADDILTNKGIDVFGYNLYSYCQNSPLGKADYDGHDLGLTLSLLSVALSSLSAVGAAIAEAAVPILCGVAIGVAIAGTVMIIVETEKLKAEMYSNIADAITNAKKDTQGEEIGDSKTEEQEYKKKKNIKGKKSKDNVAERFKGQKPFKGESGKEAAKRVLQEYGEYDPKKTGPGSDFNQLKKYFDTHFE